MEEKLDGNYTRMPRAILEQVLEAAPNKAASVRSPTTHQENYPFDESDMRDTAGENRDELISDIFLGTPSHGRAKEGRPARTYIQHLCIDTGCSIEDLQGAMDDRDGWRERVREISAGSVTWWWWWHTIRTQIIYIHIYMWTEFSIKYKGWYAINYQATNILREAK